MASTTVLPTSLGMNDHQQTDLGAMITLATLNDRHAEVMVRLACKGFPSWVGTVGEAFIMISLLIPQYSSFLSGRDILPTH